MKLFRWIFLGFLFLLTLFLLIKVWQFNNNFLRVTFLDVGQGDAILITAPNGNQMLIDAGVNKSVLRGLGRNMSWSDRFIDVVVATHPDADHIGGLPFVLERFGVGVVIDPGVVSETSIYKNFQTSLVQKNIPTIVGQRGVRISLDKDTTFTIFSPQVNNNFSDSNDISIVGKLNYQGVSFLFTGDASMKVENSLLYKNPSLLQADILKAGHHGSKTSTNQAFLEFVDPDYVVISAGRDNRYGHPHSEVVDRILNFGSLIFSTAESGDVNFYVTKNPA